jgi:integrase
MLPHADTWLQYFNPRAALDAVAAHIAALPSSRTDEKHTLRVYGAGIKYFLNWAGDQLPTPDLIKAFTAHLVQRNLKSSTIASKYLAPVRLYLKRLAEQPIRATGAEREFVSDCRDQIRQAAAIPTPKPETTSNIAPLWRPEFTRLDLKQVNAVLRQLPRHTLAGLRDYALLHIAFSTGLRLAEIARITLNSIQPTPDGEGYIITVRGKRSNIDPVPISRAAYTDICKYVQAFNEPLAIGDPRRIQGNLPLWQPLHSGTTHFTVSRYTPASGLSHQSIREIIAKRTAQALGEEWSLAAHDTRRTAAAIAYDAGMPLPDIQALLRHKDAAVTLRYVGNKPDFHKRSLSTYVAFG